MSTTKAAKPWKYTSIAYIAVVGCWIIYATLTLLAPQATTTRLHMSETVAVLVLLSIIIPVHLIWLVAIRGAVTFKNYAHVIGQGKESPGLNNIADGLIWMVAYLISGTLLSAVVPYLGHSSLLDPVIVIKDHLSPLIALVAFLLLYRGSHQLRDVTAFTTWTSGTIWMLVGFAVFAAAFALEFTFSPATSTADTTRTSLSIVPHSILLFTMVLPYLAAWFVGLLAAVNITKYAAGVKGILYRQALGRLVQGISAVIFLGAALQAVSFASRFLVNLGLGSILIIVYSVLILYGLGFVLIHAGAKKLTQIEVVQ